jgi:hypothetical protein
VTKNDFANRYFAFLLSGKAEDLSHVSEAYDTLLKEGVPTSEIQDAMDQAHQDAEMLCLMMDKPPVDKAGNDA